MAKVTEEQESLISDIEETVKNIAKKSKTLKLDLESGKKKIVGDNVRKMICQTEYAWGYLRALGRSLD